MLLHKGTEPFFVRYIRNTKADYYNDWNHQLIVMCECIDKTTTLDYTKVKIDKEKSAFEFSCFFLMTTKI